MSTLKILKENDNFNIVSDGKILINNLNISNIYTVGSIYISTNDTEPGLLFGGTWTKIQDKFLLASGSTYTNGSTGGSADAVVVNHSHIIIDKQGRSMGYNSGNTGFYSRIGSYTSNTDIGEQYRTSSNGESGTGKNMPPYLVVNIWERVS